MILAVSSRAFIDACACLGLDIASMLREVGIAETTLRDPDGRLPAEAVRHLWTIAHARTKDPDLALHAAEALPFGAYRAIDFLVANAPTIGQGLSKLAEYFRIINPAVEITLDRDGERGGQRQGLREPWASRRQLCRLGDLRIRPHAQPLG